MFISSGLKCELNKDNNRKEYMHHYDPSYHIDTRRCQGYIGEGIINCNAKPLAGVQRICKCLSQGTVCLLFSYLLFLVLSQTFV